LTVEQGKSDGKQSGEFEREAHRDIIANRAHASWPVWPRGVS
jgi:hypothetical protein